MASMKVARAADVPPGEGRVVQAGDKSLAPMGDGDLEGRLAVCPWHGWRWDVTTGANANNPAVKIACFETSVVDGDVYVELP